MREIKFQLLIMDNELDPQKQKDFEPFHEWLGKEGWVHDFFHPAISSGVFTEDLLGDGFLGSVIRRQFTGLKDKNGVEIYEGDILKLIHGSLGMIGYVKIQDSGEWIFYKDEGNYLSVHGNIDRIKVIGNIHENKDLL